VWAADRDLDTCRRQLVQVEVHNRKLSTEEQDKPLVPEVVPDVRNHLNSIAQVVAG